MEEVKIVYCYDENKNPIHYSKTIKSNKYYCIDCGAELICKDGKKKIKHLAHKNCDNCGGTGESILHKHWKKNLFKVGMCINIENKYAKPDEVEILEILNEVSLNKRYNKQWETDIIVDILLVTEKGDIVVEIDYKNAKDWDILKPFYDELSLLRVYEVTIGKSVNTKFKWFELYEEERVDHMLEDMDTKAIAKARIKKPHDYKIYIYNKTKIKKEDNNTYLITCLCEISRDKEKYKKINLRLNLDILNTTYDRINYNFNISRNIGCLTVTTNTKNEYVTYPHTYINEFDELATFQMRLEDCVLNVIKITGRNKMAYEYELYEKISRACK